MSARPYILIGAPDGFTLEAKVAERMAEGYLPTGGVIVTTGLLGPGKVEYLQAIYRPQPADIFIPLRRYGEEGDD